jgi:uncharacterized membrane protein YczE
MKKIFYTEAAYVAGTVLLALGTALMEKADFGMSTVVAPAYLLYMKLSQSFPFFTFGMAEYTLQAVLLILLAIVLRRFRKSYLFSFATALIYGFALDLMMKLTAPIVPSMPLRIILYIIGMIICAAGVAFYFRSYISPAAYELCVSEISAARSLSIDKVKIIYDVCSCAIAVLMSFLFFGFGHFEGVRTGTFICALLNGILIGFFSRAYDRLFDFRDGLPLRKYFEI